MAMARKCDRCGKYYDRNEKYLFGRENVIGIRFESPNKHNDRIDLCDECLEKTEEFLGTDILKGREE